LGWSLEGVTHEFEEEDTLKVKIFIDAAEAF